MTVPYSFSAATSAIPLSQLDDNFNTTITLGNTAIQLGNTVTTLNNMTLANVTISSGNVTITNVSVTTANVTTVNATTVIATTANVTTGNVTNLISGNVALTGGAINGTTLGATTAASANVTTLTTSSTVTINGGTANGVAYLNGSKVLTTGSALTFDGTNLATTGTSTGLRLIASSTDAGGSVLQVDTTATAYGRVGGSTTMGYVAGTQSLWTIGATEQMRLTSTGLGIGTSSPVYQTQIYGSGQTTAALTDAGNKGGSLLLNTPTVAAGDGGALLLGAGGSGAKPFAAIKGLLTDGGGNTTGAIAFSTRNATGDTALTERMRLDSSGRLGIGVTPNTLIDAGGASTPIIRAISSSTNNAAARMLTDGDTVYFGSQNSSTSGGNVPVVFQISGTERARIDSSGNLVGAGTTSIIYWEGVYNNTTASAANMFVASNGSFGRSTSALKYKQDIRDLESVDVDLLRPVRYKSKCENDDQTKDHFGLIADEAADAGFEELVTRGSSGEVEGFQYERLTVVLLKEIQSLRQRVAQLEGA